MFTMYNRCLCRLRAGAVIGQLFSTNLGGSGNGAHPPRGSATQRACASTTLSGADFNLTVEDALKKWNKIFQEKQISEPLESIANILASTLRTNKISEVYKNRKHVLSDLQVENVTEMCQKRLQSMPVQYIVGEWDFRQITLKVRPPVFIPRPETELLVEHVLKDIKDRNITEVLELCCGSGAISLSLLHEQPQLQAYAIDKSPSACRLTSENAEFLGLSTRLSLHQSDVTNAPNLIKKKFDVIVSNPPYILSPDMKSLQPEILLYEDLEALDGGEDGLNVIKQIFTVSSRFLNSSGKLFLEVDPTHPQLIERFLAGNEHHLGLRQLGSHKDLCNDVRFVEIIKV